MKRTKFWAWLACAATGCNAVAGTESGQLPETPPVCSAGDVRLCYEGPEQTQGVGICRVGFSTCLSDGSGFGACEESVEPRDEVANGFDDDCDGAIDDGISCVPGTARACYSGSAGTLGVGMCAEGFEICEPTGMGYGPCIGEVLPGNEVPGNAFDDDCDGIVDTPCIPGTVQPCYSGPANTDNVGRCASGIQVCNVNGQGYGECLGEVTPTVELCTAPTNDENCDGHVGCTGGHVWSKAFGEALYHAFNGLAIDRDGNAVVSSWFWRTIDFGLGTLTSAGDSDVVVAKFDTTGQTLWSRKFGDANAQTARGIATDMAGNIYIGGSFEGSIDFGAGAMASVGNHDVFIAKLDPHGNAVWSKRFGGAGHDYNVGVRVDTQGNVVLVGSVWGTADLGAGSVAGGDNWDAFLVKLDPGGNPIWNKRFVGSGYEEAGAGIAIHANDDIVVTGYMQGPIDIDGSHLAFSGGFDVFMAKFDAAGNHAWSRSFGGIGNDRGHSVAMDSAGNIVLGGNIEATVNFGGGPLTSGGSEDAFVAKFTPMGAHIWSKSYACAGPWESAADLAIDAADNIAFVSGIHWGTADYGGGPLTTAGGRDPVVVKLDTRGNHIWSKRFGDAAIHQYNGSVAVNPAGDVFIAGYFSGTMDFGGGPLVAPSDVEGHMLYVAKLLP